VKRWRWVREDVVYAIQGRQLAEHGGPTGILDEGRLQAALARPRNLAAYEKPDAASLAAAYAHGIVRNHPFVDGNKRSAWIVARLFLADNRCSLRFDPVDAVRVMQSAAAGTITETDLADWFRQRITKG